MTETLTLGLVAAGSVLGGSIVTGWFTLRASVNQREALRNKRRLIQALRDVAAFHRLEERYTKALASEQKSPESWKREVRRQQFEDNLSTPSEDGTARKAEQRILELE